jgi:hypothetical protein
MQKRPKIIKEKKIYKNIYELNIDLKFNKKTKFVKENFIFNGKSVSAICYNIEEKYFILLDNLDLTIIIIIFLLTP